MTPFDPAALVAMLLAFYPIVSAAWLATARRDRPEYFAGGVLFGSKGDKLRLPDGREWDCIVAAGGPLAGRRWQCSLIVIDPNAVPDPFALEEGPLTVLDEEFTIGPRVGSGFEALVAGELEALGASDDVLHQAAQAAIEFNGGTLLDASYDRLVAPALEHHAAFVRSLDADNPIDEVEASGQHDAIIDATEHQYDEEEPEDLPLTDPGQPPDEGKDPPVTY